MAEEKRVASAARSMPAKESSPKSASRALASAAASSDPAVHQLLAELQTANANGNEEEAAAVTERLAGLGYE